MPTSAWPPLKYETWGPTRETVHLWTQVLGKIKLALTPFLNEWWNVGLSLTARGLSTGLMPAGDVDLQMDFDLVGSELVILTSKGRERTVELRPRSVADFYEAVMQALQALDVRVTFSTLPVELTGAIRFEQDTTHQSYDPTAVQQWWRAMLSVARVMDTFRTPFGGKSSPVLFYWGGCDLNHTRFSGRTAPPREGAGPVLRYGEDQENVAIGFWPGDATSPHAVLYGYISPAPDGVADLKISPEEASWVAPLGEFVLPWEALVASRDPDALALEFFTSVYEQTSALAGWDRSELELASVPGKDPV